MKTKQIRPADIPMSQAEKPRGFKGRILARFMAMVHRDEFRAVDMVLGIGPEDSYLELGCGSGLFIKKYASAARIVAGLDHSPDMVRLAGYFNRRRVASGTGDFVLGDVASLPWEGNRFTGAAAIATFMFWPDPSRALGEIHRVLAPGGRLVISLGWNADDGKDHSGHARKYGIRLYSKADMKKLLAVAGFGRVSFYRTRGFMMPALMVARGEKL